MKLWGSSLSVQITFSDELFFRQKSCDGIRRGSGVLLGKRLSAGDCGCRKQKRPLSDQMIAKRLSAMFFPISRRSVAKYRAQLGIADASGRKEY